MLQKQLAAAEARFKNEQKDAAKSRADIAARAKEAQAELERLMKEID